MSKKKFSSPFNDEISIAKEFVLNPMVGISAVPQWFRDRSVWSASPGGYLTWAVFLVTSIGVLHKLEWMDTISIDDYGIISVNGIEF